VFEPAFSFGPRGAGIRRLTSRQKIQGNQYQKERLIRHTGQSGHGSGDSGPKWLAHPRPENHAEEKSFHPLRRGPRRNLSSGLKDFQLSQLVEPCASSAKAHAAAEAFKRD